ncbi:MAG TPA: J domain-containing protein [Vicinamibacterales bacterium]|nr:J domain-containing protein [Vicinamibacterales bacterium]
MKSHYELLGLEHSADADAIKKAFRREIARYHPDKVSHLGAEFQEMAATRAAELTVAYKTLSDAVLRAEYDAALAAGAPVPHVPTPTPPPLEDDPAPFRPPADAASPAADQRFASERADRDLILRRAIAARVLSAVEAAHGKCETPTVRGFDLAMVPLAKPRFLGTPPPRVLVRVVDLADAAALSDAVNGAFRARLHAGKSPVVVLLFARRIVDQSDLSKAWDTLARQSKPPDAPDLSVVVIDVADWSCRLPPNCSNAARKLAAQICA